MSQSYNPNFAVTKLVWTNPISLAATIGITIVFSSSGYLDVSVLRVHLPCGITVLQTAGLPHSEICGSTCMCQSPQLIAAYHVLLRLWEPRHSPYALNLLIVLFCSLMSYSINLVCRKTTNKTLLLFIFSYSYSQYVNERFSFYNKVLTMVVKTI